MKRHLFLLSWVAGTEGACEEDTQIENHIDLFPQYKMGNENVFAVEIRTLGQTPTELLEAVGYKEAFLSNYTANDTVSILEELEDDFVHPAPGLVHSLPCKVIVVP